MSKTTIPAREFFTVIAVRAEVTGHPDRPEEVLVELRCVDMEDFDQTLRSMGYSKDKAVAEEASCGAFQQLLKDRNTVGAIKKVREALGVSLRDAKLIVDGLL